jgi:hypothetical protein
MRQTLRHIRKRPCHCGLLHSIRHTHVRMPALRHLLPERPYSGRSKKSERNSPALRSDTTPRKASHRGVKSAIGSIGRWQVTTSPLRRRREANLTSWFLHALSPVLIRDRNEHRNATCVIAVCTRRGQAMKWNWVAFFITVMTSSVAYGAGTDNYTLVVDGVDDQIDCTLNGTAVAHYTFGQSGATTLAPHSGANVLICTPKDIQGIGGHACWSFKYRLFVNWNELLNVNSDCCSSGCPTQPSPVRTDFVVQ